MWCRLWYLDRDGGKSAGTLMSIDTSIQPPSYAVRVDSSSSIRYTPPPANAMYSIICHCQCTGQSANAMLCHLLVCGMVHPATGLDTCKGMKSTPAAASGRLFFLKMSCYHLSLYGIVHQSIGFENCKTDQRQQQHQVHTSSCQCHVLCSIICCCVECCTHPEAV